MNEPGKLVRLTALHRTHLKLGAKMQERQGWFLPASYDNVEREVENATLSAGICDISHYGKIDAKASDIDRFLRGNLSDLTAKRPGEVRFDARIRGEGTSPSRVLYVCRLAKEHALIFTQALPQVASALGVPEDLFRSNQSECLTNITSVLAGVSLVGPSSDGIIGTLTQARLSSTSADGSFCAEGGLAKVYSLVVHGKMNHEGRAIPFYDIYFGRDYAEYVWEAMMDAGHEFGLMPTGLEAYCRIGGVSAPKAGMAGER